MHKKTKANLRRSVVRTLGLTAAVAVVLALTACNATKGLGKDLEESSDNVKNAGK
ncbi:MAG: hypothetical protein U0573_06980 [Phycisphaerales bacterium]|nr:hypothetical protein [Planctomycetota bacterium]